MEWNTLRLVDKATLEAVKEITYDCNSVKVCNEVWWKQCFPKAIVANVSFRRNTLIRYDLFSSLQKLNLCSCVDLEDDDFIHFSQIIDLNVSHTLVTDDGLLRLQKVEVLNIGKCCHVSGTCFAALTA